MVGSEDIRLCSRLFIHAWQDCNFELSSEKLGLGPRPKLALEDQSSRDNGMIASPEVEHSRMAGV